MSNSLDPDQARQNARPDLVPNCLKRLSADGTGDNKLKYLPSALRRGISSIRVSRVKQFGPRPGLMFCGLDQNIFLEIL